MREHDDVTDAELHELVEESRRLVGHIGELTEQEIPAVVAELAEKMRGLGYLAGRMHHLQLSIGKMTWTLPSTFRQGMSDQESVLTHAFQRCRQAYRLGYLHGRDGEEPA
jgi:hypothetical protein